MFTDPATSPFSEAIRRGSERAIFLVRLLSNAQQRQAPRMAIGPWMSSTPTPARPGQHDGSGHDGGHADGDAAVEILPEGEPCQKGGKHPFAVQ